MYVKFRSDYVVFRILSHTDSISLYEIDEYINEFWKKFPHSFVDLSNDSLSWISYSYNEYIYMENKTVRLTIGTSSDIIKSFAEKKFNWMYSKEDNLAADEVILSCLKHQD